jgi:hypothetical protein
MKPDRQDQELGFGMNLAFLNGLLKSPLRPPFSKGGNGGISADAFPKRKM